MFFLCFSEQNCKFFCKNFNSQLITFILRWKTRKFCYCHLRKFLRHNCSPLASPCFVAYVRQRAQLMIALIYRLWMKTPWKTEWVCDIFFKHSAWKTNSVIVFKLNLHMQIFTFYPSYSLVLVLHAFKKTLTEAVYKYRLVHILSSHFRKDSLKYLPSV